MSLFQRKHEGGSERWEDLPTATREGSCRLGLDLGLCAPRAHAVAWRLHPGHPTISSDKSSWWLKSGGLGLQAFPGPRVGASSRGSPSLLLAGSLSPPWAQDHCAWRTICGPCPPRPGCLCPPSPPPPRRAGSRLTLSPCPGQSDPPSEDGSKETLNYQAG